MAKKSPSGKSKPEKSGAKAPAKMKSRTPTAAPPGAAPPSRIVVPRGPKVGPAVDRGTIPGATVPPKSQYCYPLRFPERYTETSLTGELGGRLAGTPADGSPLTSRGVPGKVIWVDAGDELLVHLDSLRIKLMDRLIVASVDLECDQTGRTPLVCVFATSSGAGDAGLFCTTDEWPRGNELLASRWGEVVQNAIWNSLLALLRDHAAERRVLPAGLSAVSGALQLRTTADLGTIAPAKRLDEQGESR